MCLRNVVSSCILLHTACFTEVRYIVLIPLGRIIDTCSAITNFMEFFVMLEKCQFHMVASQKVQVVRNMVLVFYYTLHALLKSGT
jgi:hypothetical protein